MGYQKFNVERFARQFYRFREMFEYEPGTGLHWLGRPEDKDQALRVLEEVSMFDDDVYQEIHEEEQGESKDTTMEAETNPVEDIPLQVQATEAVANEIIKNTTLPSGEDAESKDPAGDQ